MRLTLTLLLVLSVALNIYLWLQLPSPEQPPPRLTAERPAQAMQDTGRAGDAPEPGRPASLPPNARDFEAWLEAGDYDRLSDALTAALKDAPFDARLLMLEAELMVRTAPLADAIVHYYGLLELPLAAPYHREIETRIQALVTTAVEQLQQNGSWSLLAQLMEPLFQRVPTEDQYARWLAEAYARQNKATLTEDVLAALPANDPHRARIRAQLDAPALDDAPGETEVSDNTTQGSRETIAIALERGRDQYFAHVAFNNQPARLLFDTGASMTAITQSLYRQLARRTALTFIGNFTVNTAAGRIRAPMFDVPLMVVGPLRFEQTPVLVLPPDVLPDADGLLGMNVLRNYHFAIDQQRALLTLSPRHRQTNR